MHHMDVRSAFLNDDLLEEVIYVRQPPGCVVDGKEDMVLRLDKALYELRLAPRAVYARGHGSSRLLVGVYVDDLRSPNSRSRCVPNFR